MNSQDLIARAAAPRGDRFGIAFGTERLALIPFRAPAATVLIALALAVLASSIWILWIPRTVFGWLSAFAMLAVLVADRLILRPVITFLLRSAARRNRGGRSCPVQPLKGEARA